MPKLIGSAPRAKREQVLKAFRLIGGSHAQPDYRMPRTKVIDKETHQERAETYEEWKGRTQTLYFRGDIVESPAPLSHWWPEKFVLANEFHASQEGPNPFMDAPAPGETEEEFKRRRERLRAQQEQKAPPQQSQAKPSKPLTSMSLKELQELAAEEEIDLKGKTQLRDVLYVVQQAMQAVSGAK